MDCSNASEADRVCEWGDGVQWPNDKNPMFFFMTDQTTRGVGLPPRRPTGPSSPQLHTGGQCITAAVSAGDLSTLGQDADRIATIESLSVPSGGGGIGRDMCVLIFEWAGVCVGRGSTWRAEVTTVGADEAEPAGAGGEDLELTRVMRDVVAFTQQQQIVQVGAAAVDPVDAVVGVQVLGVRAARVGAVAVLTGQERAVVAVGDQPV